MRILSISFVCVMVMYKVSCVLFMFKEFGFIIWLNFLGFVLIFIVFFCFKGCCEFFFLFLLVFFCIVFGFMVGGVDLGRELLCLIILIGGLCI